MQIAGSTFLISGGSSGLGAACGRKLIESGGNVRARRSECEQGEALAGRARPRAKFQRTDVTDKASVQAGHRHGARRVRFVARGDQLRRHSGAGRVVGKKGPHDLELFARIVQVNLIGTFNVIRLAAAAMATSQPNDEGERGVIVTRRRWRRSTARSARPPIRLQRAAWRR